MARALDGVWVMELPTLGPVQFRSMLRADLSPDVRRIATLPRLRPNNE
jgi:hypothetical protein